MTFLDRRDAGRRLALRLAHHQSGSPIVLGLPCWGVVVGYEIARALGAPLDLVVARRIRGLRVPRAALGAVAEGGQVLVDGERVSAAGVTASDLKAIVAREQREVERWAARFRGCRPFPSVQGRDVIVVDDGATYGHRATVAVRVVRAHAPARVVVAVPVIAPAALIPLRREADDLVYLDAPPRFVAVNYWYARCGRSSDEEVEALLQSARHEWAERQGARLP